MLSLFAVAFLAAEPVAVAPPAETSTILATPVIGPPPPVIADCCVIKALTPVRLAITNPINSNQAYPGQRFSLTLGEPILLENGRLIPAGTPGEGEVVHAARTGLAGKPGELLLAARFLDYRGVRIPLRSMRFGGSGKDNVGLAMITYAAVGVIGLVISGGQVRVLAGAPANAKISTDTHVDAGLLDAPALVAPALAPPVTTTTTTEGNTQ